MKTYSNYFKTMMILAIISAICAFIAWDASQPTLCAIMCTTTFIFWYGGVMAPKEEKYKIPEKNLYLSSKEYDDLQGMFHFMRCDDPELELELLNEVRKIFVKKEQYAHAQAVTERMQELMKTERSGFINTYPHIAK